MTVAQARACDFLRSATLTLMRVGIAFAFIAAIVIAARLCHSSVLWADDNLPLAAAMEVARGKVLYRECGSTNRRLVAWLYLLWGARAGVWLRLAGAVYVIGVAAAAWQFARTKWSEREGLLAASLCAFFLTFGSAVGRNSASLGHAAGAAALAGGIPRLARASLLERRRGRRGLLCSSKAVFVLAACALWQWRQAPQLLAGFVAPNAVALAWMWMHGSAGEYYRQVWQWGSIYAANTFVENPLAEG